MEGYRNWNKFTFEEAWYVTQCPSWACVPWSTTVIIDVQIRFIIVPDLLANAPMYVLLTHDIHEGG